MIQTLRYRCRTGLPLAFPLLLICLSTGCDESAPADSTQQKGQRMESKSGAEAPKDGTADAERDIAAGKLLLWTQPLPSPPWANEVFSAARDNGIELKATAKPADFHTDYIQSYNRRMNQEIEKKLGAGFMAKLKEKARKDFESKQPRKGN